MSLSEKCRFQLLFAFSAALLPLAFLSVRTAGADLKGVQKSVLNINKVEFWAANNGLLASGPEWNQNWGLIYPKGTAGLVFTDGLVWAGYVRDGQTPELRAGGQYYTAGTVPGRILSPGAAADTADAGYRIWRIRRDWQTADLTQDAASFFGVPPEQVTSVQIDSLRTLYRHDWENWPGDIGAPYYDRNNNGTYDAGDEPGIAEADQVIWFVYNDLDVETCTELYGAPPIGLEVQVTLWAYHLQSGGDALIRALDHVIYKRYRIIYKGTKYSPANARIDSMLIGQFVETDIGDYSDDFLGCDTLLQLGYGYNSQFQDKIYKSFSIPPPAVGYALLQGPVVASADPQAQAVQNFKIIRGYRNLPMTFFWAKATGSTILDPERHTYEGTQQMYNLLNGLTPRGAEPFKDPNGHPVRYMFPGDPVTSSGWTDGNPLAAGDRRFLMSSGPFSMALGDTQEVIFAIAVGKGADERASVSVMKYNIRYARSVFGWSLPTAVPGKETAERNDLPEEFLLLPNRPNPFRGQTLFRFVLKRPGEVRLSVFNALGQQVDVLLSGCRPAGEYHILWRAQNGAGRRLPAGIYFVRLQAGRNYQIQKMLLLP